MATRNPLPQAPPGIAPQPFVPPQGPGQAPQNALPQPPVPQRPIAPPGTPTMNALPGLAGPPLAAPDQPPTLNPLPEPPPAPPPGYASGGGYPAPGFAAPPPWGAQPAPYAPPMMAAQSVPSAAPVAVPNPTPTVSAPTVVAAPPPAPPPPPQPPKLSPFLRPAASKRERAYSYRLPSPAAFEGASRVIRPNLAPPNEMVLPAADLRGLLPEKVRDDGGDSRGYAVSSLRELRYAKTTSTMVREHLSPRYVTERATGSSLIEELVVLLTRGVCPEPWMREGEAADSRADLAAAMFGVSELVLVDVTRLKSEDPQVRVAAHRDLKHLIGTQHCGVAVSFLVFESWERPDDRGSVPLYDPEEGVLGVEAVLLVGYGQDGWLARTSAGSDWGAGGYVTMPYGYEGCWVEAWSAR